MTRDEFVRWAKSRGYQEGAIPNRLVKDNSSFLLGPDTVSLQRNQPDRPEDWTEKIAGPYTELSINEKGMLVGFDKIAERRERKELNNG
jgi:hypothetical protein